MSRIAVVNRQNNMGDAMSQMRCLKEYKERHPEATLDFYTNLYLHWIVANHTDLFAHVFFSGPGGDPYGEALRGNYNEIIEFTIAVTRASEIGIVKAWGETTLGFAPSINRPYFLLTEEEKIQAQCQYIDVMQNPYPTKPPLRKSVILQLEAVSDGIRSFRQEDWNKIVGMIPEDVAIFYMAPIAWRWTNPLFPRPNLIVLPGYPIGATAALAQKVDAVFAVHSGPLFLAHAVDAQPIIQFGFSNGWPSGADNLLRIPEGEGENIFFPSNSSINWDAVQDAFNRYLL